MAVFNSRVIIPQIFIKYCSNNLGFSFFSALILTLVYLALGRTNFFDSAVVA
jgi:hypothetical protein